MTITRVAAGGQTVATRRWRRLTVAGLLIATLGATAPAVADVQPQTTCTRVAVPITLPGGLTGPIAGTLCAPAGATTVQVLVHGFTYGEDYWDFPYQPETYSYARAANEAGYATLAIDRLGIGESYHPLSAFVTLQNNADAVHQVVQALRRGDLGPSYAKVVLVGHSYGSMTSTQEAGIYRDVDAVVATGFAHRFNVVNITIQIVLPLRPAILDPKFAGSGLDPGYLTSPPGGRAVFYHSPNADPAVIALDEELKQTGALGELLTFPPDLITKLLLLAPSRRINVPVLVVNGTEEPFFCGLLAADCSSSAALLAGERPYLPLAPAVEATAVPGTGHNVTLERNAPDVHATIIDFVDRHVGA